MKTLRHLAAGILLLACSTAFAQTSTPPPRTFTTFTLGGWSSTVTYHIGDEIVAGNILYISVTPANLNNNPATDTAHTNWLALTSPPASLTPSVAVAATDSGGAVISAKPPGVSALMSTNNGLYVAGDSIGCATGASAVTTGYAYLLHLAIGGPYRNSCRSGDMTADQAYQRIYTDANPRGDGTDRLYVHELSTNDLRNYQADANKQKVFKRTVTGSLAWLSIPLANKTFAQASTLTGSWYNVGPRAGFCSASNTNGNQVALSFTTTIASQAVYLWYVMQDGNGGTFTAAVDGGSLLSDAIGGTTTFTTAGDGGVAIQTQNGVPTTIAGARFVIPTAGAHNFVATVTSSTSGSNQVAICGIGVSPAAVSTLNPYVVAAGAAHEIGTNASYDTYVPTYNGFTTAIVSTLVGDRANVLYADLASALGTTTANFIGDGLHPTDTGHATIAATIEGLLPASFLTANVLQTNTRNSENYSTKAASGPSDYPSTNPGNDVTGWGHGIKLGDNLGQTQSLAYYPATGVTILHPENGAPGFCVAGYGVVGLSGNTFSNQPPDHVPTPQECLIRTVGNGIITIGLGGSGNSGPIVIDNTGLGISGGKKLLNSDQVMQDLTPYQGGYTTTAATSDVIGGLYVYSTSACQAIPQNATAAAMTGYYVIWTSTHTLTFYHPATAGGIFRIACAYLGAY